jgi:HlyD family secretion protein
MTPATGSKARQLGRGLGSAALLGVALCVSACNGKTPQVTTVAVARESISTSVNTNGKIEPVAPYPLRAKFETFVEKVRAAQGDVLRAGQPILDLNADAARAALARARGEAVAAEEQLRAARAGGSAEDVAQLEADLRKSEADLARLRRERDALTRLVAKQAATREELDKNKVELDRAEAEARRLQQKKEELARSTRVDAERATLALERARSDIAMYQDQLRSAQLAAPAAGTLYNLPVRAGDFLHTGDLLAEMADLTRVRVRVFVDEPELGGLEPGQPVEITWDAMPGRVWQGKTGEPPRAVQQRGSRFVGELLCSMDNSKSELLPNTNVNVVIRERERPGALTVPRAAVRQEGATRYVFVMDGNTLRRRNVKTGIASASKFEVLEGLTEKDRVAIPGDVELRDGLEVRPVPQSGS